VSPLARHRLERSRDVPGLASLLASPPPEPDLAERVAAILADVRARGDDALVELVRRFDAPDFTRERLVAGEDEIDAAAAALAPALREAILFAARQVRALAEAQLPGELAVRLAAGQEIVVRVVPVADAGVYVPGGRAPYPSTVVMGVIPAQVAGVERVVLASPPGPDGRVAAVVLAAAGLLGVDEVLAVGGPAAIGALAFGTDTIRPVAVVAGPGNAWVQEAKRQVFGTVGIDGIAGPSEVLIVADDSTAPDVLAADLLAQAEHGPDSPAVLASDDDEVLDAVAAVIGQAGGDPGRVSLVACASRDLALELAEAVAPEHLQLNLRDGSEVARGVRSAGCVFVGPNGGTAFGDYVAGSNHILPTGGAARFASGVGPSTYLRRMAVVDLPDAAVAELTRHLAALADAEGFPAHRRSAEIRLRGASGGRK
jgi:histidinol dehydrogenase